MRSAQPIRPLVVWLLAGLLALLCVQPAAAHGYIVRAIPEDRAALERAPTRVQYWFSEALERDYSVVNVRDQSGTIIASGGVTEEDGALMRVQLPPDLPDGAYIVELRPAFASDGHVVAESRVFFVGSEVSGVTGSAASTGAVPLEVVWRGLSLTAAMVLFGVFALYAGILVPAWGSHKYAAGLLPPRVMTRLYWLIGGGIALLAASSVLALLQQAMTFFNTGIEQVITQGLWNIARIGSRFGDVWNFRMMLLVLVTALFAAALYYRRSQPVMVRPFLTAATPVMALVLGTFSVVSHAAGSQILPWVGVIFDWLHATAVGFWIGALAAFVLVMPVALQPYTGEARRLALLAALRRLSRWSMAALAVVVSTGVFNSSLWISSASTAQTTFGGALAFKLLLVAGLVALGAAHHAALRPERYARFAGIVGRLGGYGATLRLEVVIGVGVLIAAGLLTATPVPVPDFAQTDVPVPAGTVTAGDYTVSVTVSPGGPGINTFDTRITDRDGRPVDGISVSAQHVLPLDDRRSPREALENIEGALYVTANDSLDVPGMWWTLLDIQTAQGDLTRAAFVWDIRPEASIIESRPPGIVTLAALAATLAAAVWAISPGLKRFYAKQDINPLTVSVALWATAATIVFAIAGYVIVTDTQNAYRAILNPTPEIVNDVLPDGDSLARGAALFAENCAGWEGAPLDELRQRLPRTRDAELFAFTRDGWRGLPACADVDAADRWDLVNYVRTIEAGVSVSASN